MRRRVRSFELQTFREGKWKIDSVFDDRTYAIDEAKRLDASTRYSGVRVVEENYDEATNGVTSRTLFRGGAAKSDNAGTKQAPAPRPAPSGGTGGAFKGGYRGRKAKKSGFLVPVLLLLVVVLGGAAALLGLHHLSSLK